MGDAKPTFVCVPMAVQAFSVSNDYSKSKYRVAPLIQPDYSGLRHPDGLIKHDVLEQLNLSEDALNPSLSTRFSSDQPERNGIYLSWCLPRGYRTAVSATASAADGHADVKAKSGFAETAPKGVPSDSSLGEYRPVPDRWIIFRSQSNVFINQQGYAGHIPEVFVVESNRVRRLEDTDMKLDIRNGLGLVDVENVTAPFIDPDATAQDQVSTFLGRKFSLMFNRGYMPSTNESDYRVPLTVVENANELFADYQPHNSSVFSIFDDLSYKAPNRPDNCSQLDSGTFSYVVCGFHSDPSLDPLASSEADTTNADILASMSISIATPEPDPGLSKYEGVRRDDFLKARPLPKNAARMICHGALNGIHYNRTTSPPEMRVPSIELQDLVRTAHPVAVGDSPMDALLAYLRVANPSTTGTDDITTLLAALEPIIIGDGDDVTSQVQAEDERASGGFLHVTGGTVWHLAHDGDAAAKGEGKDPPSSPSPDQIQQAAEQLAQLNNMQAAYDAAQREMRRLRENLWYEWWKCTTDSGYFASAGGAAIKAIKNRVAALVYNDVAVSRLSSTLDSLKALLVSAGPRSMTLQPGKAPSYLKGVDPTVLIAGVPSGWPEGYGEVTQARLLHQSLPAIDFEWIRPEWYPKYFRPNISHSFPAQAGAIEVLTAEWALRYGNDQEERGRSLAMVQQHYLSESDGYVPPMYENAGLADNNGVQPQGWFPLFIEWEVEYYHVPWKYWEFVPGPDGVFTYQLVKTPPLAGTDVGSDCRVFGGRSTIAPDAALTLRNRLRQLLHQLSPEELDEHFANPDLVQSLLKDAISMQYLSTSLDGLVDHLLTLKHGTHVSATVSAGRGQALAPHKELLSPKDWGITPDDLLQIGKAGADEFTPYGSTVPLGPHYKSFSPFKPVTHGQARFTKLTIVDKFGQVVTCVDPPQSGGGHYALYPCTSPAVSCSWLDVKDPSLPPVANTVVKADPDSSGLCQFFQLLPRINQESRLNVHPLVPAAAGSKARYRIASDWDNPIWGWVIMNFADDSIQTYTGEGELISELALMPDDRPPVVSRPSTNPSSTPTPSPSSARMAALTTQLATSPAFIRAFFNMLGAALNTTTSTPASYADLAFPTALGRPFALVDFGLSLELAAPPRRNQSSLSSERPDALLDYRFPYKLGDADAAFDGLVAYFPASTTARPITSMYSDFAEVSSTGIIALPPQQALRLAPRFIPADVPDRGASLLAALDIHAALVDPLVPLHVYTGGVLPPAPLELPRWAIDGALRQIGAVVRAGPLVVPRAPDLGAEAPSIRVGAPPFGSWKWLQPVAVDPRKGDKEGDAWVGCRLEKEDGGIKIGAGGAPVVVEGWLRERGV